MTSPQAGAPTRPVPTEGSNLSKEPTLRGFSKWSTTCTHRKKKGFTAGRVTASLVSPRKHGALRRSPGALTFLWYSRREARLPGAPGATPLPAARTAACPRRCILRRARVSGGAPAPAGGGGGAEAGEGAGAGAGRGRGGSSGERGNVLGRAPLSTWARCGVPRAAARTCESGWRAACTCGGGWHAECTCGGDWRVACTWEGGWRAACTRGGGLACCVHVRSAVRMPRLGGIAGRALGCREGVTCSTPWAGRDRLQGITKVTRIRYICGCTRAPSHARLTCGQARLNVIWRLDKIHADLYKGSTA